MTTRLNKKNIVMYIGNSRKFPICGWIHACYFCEAPNGNYEMFCGVEVYVCKECKYMSVGKDGSVYKKQKYNENKKIKETLLNSVDVVPESTQDVVKVIPSIYTRLRVSM